MLNTGNKELRIVWVEVGRKFPRYARNNVCLTSKLHPGVEQILISDRVLSSNFASCLNLRDIPKSNFTEHFNLLAKEWSYGQTYFWHGTTSRFFHLYDAMKHLKLENVVHLESDCVLLDSESLTNLISRNQFDIAFPLQANGLGCASIFFLRNHQAIEKFLEYTLDNWERKDINDMNLLGEYSKKAEMYILPTQLSLGTEPLEYLFDAGSVGKYFLGTEARNLRFPFSKRGTGDALEGSITEDLGRTDLDWQINNEKKKLNLRVVGPGLNAKYVNLHIHSKLISRHIRLMYLTFYIGFRMKKSLFWRIGFLDFSVVVERIVSFFWRRIMRKKDYDDRSFR